MPFLRWVFHVFVVIAVVKLQSLSSFSFNQQQLDRVLKLPGQNFNVSFEHYAGYINVNQELGRELFYWFFEAEDDPSSKPLALWLNGGPGYSSIALGLAEEIGPLHIEKDGKTLYFNPYSWNRVANILFVDSPIGVGFSYSNTPSDIVSNGDKRTADDNLIFIEQWLERFPQYKGREFYLIGESYAGHYIPQLAHAIVKHNEKHGVKTINLKGFLVGNAVTDDFHDHFGAYQLMWSVGMISDQTYKQLNLKCVHESFVHNSEECEKVLMVADQEVGDMDTFSIYTPSCPAFTTLSHLRGRKTKAGLLRRPYDPCTEIYSAQYFNIPEVQDALHVRGQNSPWETNSELVHETWQDSSQSVLDVYAELLNSGLRIWIFSGNTDATIPVTSTRYNIDAMKLRTVRPWRAWYDDGQVGGWTEEYEGLTFVVVRGAGHEVPLLKPKQALTLFKSFLSGKSMPEMERVSDM